MKQLRLFLAKESVAIVSTKDQDWEVKPLASSAKDGTTTLETFHMHGIDLRARNAFPNPTCHKAHLRTSDTAAAAASARWLEAIQARVDREISKYRWLDGQDGLRICLECLDNPSTKDIVKENLPSTWS